MTSVSAGHIILTPTQPVGSGRPQQELSYCAPQEAQYTVTNTHLYENVSVKVDADPRIDGEYPDPCDVVHSSVQAVLVLTLPPGGENFVSVDVSWCHL